MPTGYVQNAQGKIQNVGKRRLRRLPLFTLHSNLCIQMIRPLRQRHRVMVIALTITLPAAFAVGIATRREVPAFRAGVPGQLAEAPIRSELWTRNDLWEKKTITTRLLRIGGSARQPLIELVATDLIARPDVLVYWVPGERKIQGALPDDAFLLGSFEQSNPSRLALPPEAEKQTGALVLYSLADHEIVAVSKTFAGL
jgi:hypothetical protein